MGAPRVSERVFEYMKSHANTPVSANEMALALDLTQGQVRPVMRRFAFDEPTKAYFTVVVPANSWVYNPKPESSSDKASKSTTDTVDTGARKAREAGRAAAEAARNVTYAWVATFNDGAVLLRADTGKMFRGELTEL